METFEKADNYTFKRVQVSTETKEDLLTIEGLDQRQSDLEAQLAKLPITKAILQAGLKEIQAIRKEAIGLGIVAKPITKEEINGTRISKMVRI